MLYSRDGTLRAIPLGIKIMFGYILICLIWGTTWLAIKFAIFSLPPFLSAGIRFAIASLLIFLILKIRKYKFRFNFRQTIFLMLVGLGSFSVPYGLVYWAEERITSGLTATTFAVMPFFAAILSRIFLKTDDLSFWKIFGIILGFAGLSIIFWGDLRLGSIESAEGILAVVVSAFANASVAVGVKKFGREIDPLFINLIPMTLGAVTLLLTSVFVENWQDLRFDASTVASIFYLAIFGSIIAFTIYFYLLKHISVVLLSVTSFITPVLALTAGAIVLDEKFPPGILLGAALILSGVLVLNLIGEGRRGREEIRRERKEVPTE
ncbi:MAG TPA: EamA family transporter [Candidatus Acidoferrales bacterium]|nr:EamA family transporter [Candidatus Acidoferrales bacterium]